MGRDAVVEFVLAFLFGGLGLAYGGYSVKAEYPLAAMFSYVVGGASIATAFSIAMLTIIYGLPNKPEVAQPPLPVAANAATPTPVAASPMAVEEPPHPYNQFVTPRYLTDLFKGRTEAQGQALVKSNIGITIGVSGKIADITELPSGIRMGVAFEPTASQPRIFMFFSEQWFDQLKALRRGDTLKVLGVIESVLPDSVTLIQCGIVSVGDDGAK